MTDAADGEAAPPVTITFLGGLGEIGRNMATIEVGGRIAVIDVGVSFPTAEHLGVDLILPDWSPLRERADEVSAVFLTHAHEDHVGALPFFLQDFPNASVYGTRLTLAFIAAKLEEWPELADVRLVEVAPGDEVHAEPFVVEVIQVSHSIPDGCAYAFRTPHGIVVHSGDFKLDQTPVDGRPTDLAHLARLGDEVVTLLMADSTNADLPGHVPTERTVGRALLEAFAGVEGLIVVASFASHVHRIQQVLDAAKSVGRRPVFVGRSMVRNMHLARALGELDYDEDDEVDLADIERHERDGLVVVSTGSQGEPYSALSLMAAGEHRDVAIGRGDLVVLASSIIPGNERPIYRSINGLVRRGARVLHRGIANVHVSGHAARDDLILFHNIVQAEYVVPIHGEQRHMVAHRDIAIETGCLADHVLICEDGDTLIVEDGRVRRGEQTRAGLVLLDGLLSDVGPAILRDRRRLGEDGICICIITVDVQRRALAGDPTVVQKGVVFAEQNELLEGAQKAVAEELSGPARDKFGDLSALQRHVTQALGTYWRAQTGRRPVIMPIVVEI